MKIKVITSSNIDSFESELNNFIDLLEQQDAITEYSVECQAVPTTMTIGHAMLLTEYTAFIYYEGELQME